MGNAEYMGQQLGMDPQDVQDMFDLSEMMKKFLLKIPDVDTKLQLDEDDYSLEDHCKLYLLGLTNKLGPHGFLALHSILESAGEAIVDVELGSFVADDEVQGPTDVTPLGDLFSRKRRQLEAMAAKAAAADEEARSARSEEAAKGSEEDVDDDIVASILKRRRRSIESKHNKLKQIRNHFILKLINTLAKFRVGYVHKKVFSYFIGNPTDKNKN